MTRKAWRGKTRPRLSARREVAMLKRQVAGKNKALRDLRKTIARLRRSHAQKRLAILVDLVERSAVLLENDRRRLAAIGEIHDRWREIKAELVAGQ